MWAGALTSVRRVQATVRGFDEATGKGSVLLDDGTELPFAGSAFERSTLRRLRSGQRVRIRVEDGAVVALSLATLPLSRR